jgi:polysaccharide biosynthesis protein PelA
MRWVGLSWLSVAAAMVAMVGHSNGASGADVASAAATTAASEIVINREILGLYDSATEPMPEFSRLHKFLEMPLNHLGYKLTLHDISSGLPFPADAQRYRAVATWFSGRVTNADAYLAWAAQLARGGTRFVVLDSVGAVGSEAELPAVNAFLSELGVTQAAYYVGDNKETRIDRLDAAVINGEAKLDPAALPPHTVFIATKAAVKSRMTVHLSVTDPAHRWVKAPASVLVSTSNHGGFVASGYAISYDAATQRTRWVIDPFRFLEAALGQSRAPVPDTTTVSGRRLYFSHIDGDGWNNATEVEPYRGQGQRAAKVMLDQLIVPYPDLPVSVGLIAGDVIPADGGEAEGTAIARAMFAQPQVEVASHTHTHPFHWNHFNGYSRDREIATILATLDTKQPLEDRSLKVLVDKWRAAAVPVATTVSATPISADLPRARPHQPFDLAREVKGALDVSTSLAPPGKLARLYLWSGDCRPFEEVLKATRQAGVRNLNGGDSRFDALYPSQLYVPPLSRMVGAERQIYAVNSNENTYTNGWSGPFDAFKTLGETVDNTELPRRLKGFNIYYHSFSATKPEGVAAVRVNLDKARASNITPITASQYAEIAEGFFTARIIEAGRDRWVVRDRGGLNTMRFDAPDGLSIDYAASVGVIGDNRHGGSLYVTLDPAVAEPVIAVRPANLAKPLTAKAIPRLIESRWTLSAVERAPCSLTAEAQGFGAGEMTWEGLTPGAHIITASRRGVVLATRRVLADTAGRLHVRLATSAIEPLQIDMTCDPSLAAASAATTAAPAVAGAGTAIASKRAAAAARRPASRKPTRPQILVE